MKSKNSSFSTDFASWKDGMVVILMLFWDMWSLAYLVQDLGVVAQKRVKGLEYMNAPTRNICLSILSTCTLEIEILH